jgi:predicted outer membrane protein
MPGDVAPAAAYHDAFDLLAADADVGQLAVAEAAKLAHRRAVATPVAVFADQVHLSLHSL